MMNYQGTTSNKGHRSLVLLIAAFAAIYIVWGSTYLSIKYAIETIPPFLMAGLRFASAGAILYLIARLSPDFERPKFVHWRTSAVVGILLLVIGNGGVVYAERFIPSSLTALLVATEPFWIVLLSWLWLKGSRPTRKAALGLVLGFVGVAVLITGQGAGAGNRKPRPGTALDDFGCSCSGSFVGGRFDLRPALAGSELRVIGCRDADACRRRRSLDRQFICRRMEHIQFQSGVGQLMVRARISGRFRIAYRIYSIQLASEERRADDGRDVCIRQSGHRSNSRLAHCRRINDHADAAWSRSRCRIGGIDHFEE